MTKSILTALICLVFSLSSGVANAGGKGKGKGKHAGENGKANAHRVAAFEKRDADKDGSLTEDEFASGKHAAKKPAKAKKHFAKLDKDKNNKVSKEEFLAKKKGKHHGKKGKMKHGKHGKKDGKAKHGKKKHKKNKKVNE